MPLKPALPKHHYLDEGAFAVERERVLARTFTCVGRLDALGLAAGGVALARRRAVVAVHGESVVVTSDETGTLHAHHNVCRHRGAQLVAADPADPDAPAPPTCTATALRCPYHSWTYDLAGRLLKAPHTEDVTDFDSADFGLHPVAVDTWGGFLWLRLDADAGHTLAEELGAVHDRVQRYPLERLVAGAGATYDVAANWKVLAENYNECYHCGPVHPELVRLVPGMSRGGGGIDWEAGIEHREGAWTFTATGTTHRAPFPELDARERTAHKGELVYPNLWLSLAADHVATFLLEPLAVGRTRIRFEVLVEPEEAEGDCSDAFDFWDVVNRQDWDICESVQRGMASRAYHDGWFAPMEDDSLDIRRWLIPRLDAS